jgi:two-component sensor histidine kinase
MSLFETRKELLLNNLLKAIIYLGAIAYVPSMFACIMEKLYLLALVNTLGYTLLLIVLLRKRVPYSVRLYTTVLTTLGIGAAVLIETGTDGAGHIWLLCAVFIAALFGRIGIIVTTVLLTQGTMLLYGLLAAAGFLRHQPHMVSVAAISANMLLISIVLSLITHSLLKALRGEIDSQEKVLRLLHHRVKNNLQIVESLISLEDRENDRSPTLERRMRAVSVANELLLADHDLKFVELRELLRVLFSPKKVTVEGEEPLLLPAEQLTEIAVGLSDLIDILYEAGPLTVSIDSAVRIRGARPMPERELFMSRAAESLIPAGWIEDCEDMDSTGKLTLHISGCRKINGSA